MVRVAFIKSYSFLVFFIAFEWGRSFESVVDKYDVKWHLQSRPNPFSVNNYILSTEIRQQYSRTDNLIQICWFCEIRQWNTATSTWTFTEK